MTATCRRFDRHSLSLQTNNNRPPGVPISPPEGGSFQRSVYPNSRKEVTQMHKKIITVCVSLVAFGAFVLAPAMASAAPLLKEAGATLATGKGITGTNSGNILLTT